MEKTIERLITYGSMSFMMLLAIIAVYCKYKYDTKWQYTVKGKEIALKLSKCAHLAELIFLVGIVVYLLSTMAYYGLIGGLR